MVKCRKHNLTQ